MRRKRLSPLVLAAYLGAVGLMASAAAAQDLSASTEHTAAVSALIGLSPAAVRARFVDGAGDWPLQRAFQVAAGDGVLSFNAFHDLMLDQASARRAALFRAHADLPLPWEPSVSCHTRLEPATGASIAADLIVLMFRNDRLEAVLGIDPQMLEAPPLAAALSANAKSASTGDEARLRIRVDERPYPAKTSG
jgi:hypothetical protein